MKNIGIVGQGFVGNAVAKHMINFHNIYTFDTDPEKNSTEDSLHSLVLKADVIFVCLPTPMYDDGECNTSIIENVIADILMLKFDGKIIIKSTIPPGTVEKINREMNTDQVNFNPEFLTEANSVNDYKSQNRIIIGSDAKKYPMDLVEIFEKAFPEAPIIVLSTKEAEMVKYFTNLFLATKVSFFNDMYRVCQSLNIKYDNVLLPALMDKRIGESHTKVPGLDGDFGFGGHCFPKDLEAILYIANTRGVSVPTLEGAKSTNNQVRTNRDWEKMIGRAFTVKE